MSDNDKSIQCLRCGNRAAPAQNVTYGGELGVEIRSNTCVDCWQEWQNAEVMVINELRLNFMEPQSLETLTQHLREFLHLDPGTSSS